MSTVKVTVNIENCTDCPHYNLVEYGFGGVEARFCKKTRKEIICTDKIPEWCPFKKEPT